MNTPANPCGDFLWLRVEVPTAPNAEYPMAIEGISWAAVIDGEPYGYPLGTVIITSFGDGVIEGTFSWDAKDDGSFRVPTGTGVEMPPMY